MSSATPYPGEPPPAPDPVVVAITHAQRRLAMLRRLADLGMRLVEELTERAIAASGQPEPRHDPGQSFARASRAVRLTLALEARFEQDLANLRAGGAPSAQTVDPYPQPPFENPSKKKDHPSAHRNRTRDNVWDVMNSEVTDIYPAHELLDDLHERLTEGERYDRFLYRPLRESVEAICEDLGLTPDWSRWTEDGFPPDRPDRRYNWPSLWRPDPERAERRRLANAEALADAPRPSGPGDPRRRE